MSREAKETAVPAQPTDDQLATMIRHLARLHLEIERGLRPPEQLEPYMTRPAYRRLRGPQGVRFNDPSPATPEDLGSVHLSRPAPDRVLASLTTREQADQHGALAIQLQANPQGRWRITELTRLDRHLAIHRPTPSPTTSWASRIREVEEERSVLASAYRVETERLSELSGPAADRSRDLAAYWQQRLTELDHELQRLSHEARPPREREADRPVPEKSSIEDAIDRLLGPEPDEERPRRLWQSAHDEIHHYRETWQIDDDHRALGPPAENHDQSRHRVRVTDTIRAATGQLHHDLANDQTPARDSLDLAR